MNLQVPPAVPMHAHTSAEHTHSHTHIYMKWNKAAGELASHAGRTVCLCKQQETVTTRRPNNKGFPCHGMRDTERDHHCAVYVSQWSVTGCVCIVLLHAVCVCVCKCVCVYLLNAELEKNTSTEFKAETITLLIELSIERKIICNYFENQWFRSFFKTFFQDHTCMYICSDKSYKNTM